MKKQLFIFLSFFTSYKIFTHKLENTLLKKIDQAGFFDNHIIDMLQVRQKIKDFSHGNLEWQGMDLFMQTTQGQRLHGLLKNQEMLFGITYVALSTDHPHLKEYVTPHQEHAVNQFVKEAQSKTLLQRLDSDNQTSVFTGSYAIHPCNGKQLPIFISNYSIECFDMRTTHMHFGIPAHNTKDFDFAQKHSLPIQIVLTLPEGFPAEDFPIVDKQGKLLKAYTQEGHLYKIINSDFLNGTYKYAHTQSLEYAKIHHYGTEYKALLVYNFMDKPYSIQDLGTIEATLKKDGSSLSTFQQNNLKILMHYAQADYVQIVESFLLGVHKTKDLMTILIEESCKIRNIANCYLLYWSKLGTQDSERIIFKRDIITFSQFSTFCTDLVNFLSDLASSCPHALEALKKMQHK